MPPRKKGGGTAPLDTKLLQKQVPQHFKKVRQPSKKKQLLQAPADQPTMLDILSKSPGEAKAMARKRAGRLSELSRFCDDYFMSPLRTVEELKNEPILDGKRRVPSPEEVVELLQNGFNVILRGLGSKIRYLDDIKTRLHEETEMYVFRVPAYKKVNFHKAFAILAQTLTRRQINPLPQNINNLALFIDDYLTRYDLHSVIVIVDTIEMLDTISLEVLTRLVAPGSKFRLLASVERVNITRIGLLPHGCTVTIPCDSMEDYEDEIFGKDKKRAARTKPDIVPTVISVLQTVTAEQRGIFYFICEHQQEDAHGIKEEELLEKACQHYLCVTITRVRGHLREFTDHKILGTRANGSKFVKVNDPRELQEILDTKSMFETD